MFYNVSQFTENRQKGELSCDTYAMEMTFVESIPEVSKALSLSVSEVIA